MEIRPGVFLGNPSQRVRDELWKKVTNRPPLGYAAQIWSSSTPQGMAWRQYGTSKRELVEFEGLVLVLVKPLRARRRRTK
jgi:CRISPR-associated protein Cas2